MAQHGQHGQQQHSAALEEAAAEKLAAEKLAAEKKAADKAVAEKAAAGATVSDNPIAVRAPNDSSEEAAQVAAAKAKGGNVYRYATEIMGVEAPLGAIISDDDLPASCDRLRLIRLGCLEPIGELKAAKLQSLSEDGKLHGLETVHAALLALKQQMTDGFKSVNERLAKLEAK